MAADRSRRKPTQIPSGLRSVRGYLQLQKFLRELAAVLLPRGVTPRSVTDLVRIAFVQAAAERSRLRNGRVNYSRVAAQTGLSRAEIKHLLRADLSSLVWVDSDHAPVERVISGWRLDREFTTKRGIPKLLSVEGPSRSFKLLVKKYGGDIPYRAILEELKQAQAVTIKRGIIRLNYGKGFRKRGDLAFLAEVMPTFLDGLRIASADRKRRSGSPSIQRVRFPVNTELDLPIVRDRCVSSATSMLEGLKHSLSTHVTRPRKERNSAYSFTITVMLAEQRTDK
jgi:hypothetical protein